MKSAVQHDSVNHPAHYTKGGVECIVAIEAALGLEGFVHFLRGQVIKYNWRLMEKSAIAQDAGKAKFYGDLLADRAGKLEQSRAAFQLSIAIKQVRHGHP
jgi:hypothetical protein